MPIDISNPKLSDVPKSPGCYLFKNAAGEIIYVGKAKVLGNRVRSYFLKGRSKDGKTLLLVKKIESVDWIVTDNEVEALILEANLIKEHLPRYNITLKDDKSFPYIRITNEPYPQVFLTRKVVRDGSKYLGPFTNVKKVRDALKIVKKVFSIRSCSYHIDDDFIKAKKVKVCLDYHIDKCEGPCEGLVSQEDYNSMLRQVEDYLNGKTTSVIGYLTEKMKTAAVEEEFEEAAKIRDQLFAVKKRADSQKVETFEEIDRDFIAMARIDEDACGVVFRVREGKLLGQEHFFLKGVEDENTESVFDQFLGQYYTNSEYVPGEVYLEHCPAEREAIEIWLKRKRGGAVRLFIPMRGKKRNLLRMALKNAELHLKEHLLNKKARADYVTKSLSALKKDLGMEIVPRRIEAFDISNIQGKDAVGSMVCFINGSARKNEYRKFKIKSVEGPDDFAMMREVLLRRYRRVLDEEKALPDLILIDGGKGQLSAALSVLKNLDLLEIEVVGLAKRLEEIYKPDQSEPQNISKSSPGLILLRKIRDEAHRFALSYHRQLRKKRNLHSVLDDIPGVGPSKRNALLAEFQSVMDIKDAKIEDIKAVRGISTKLAESIKKQLSEILAG
ncbi:MAG: excinuclease ABC subunit C [Candidatus Marinimicrobia bacterium]|nr:excinuclease ABC subunit C [Candidatus Neomarinimicrobiota bacterium]